ncbi:MAG: ATP-binding cassette domain-containing protein [Candidatus Heimdallarchaeota archaeon]|nr:ATP-binding cassette domain-containing protein [Candidatus Heimdallarchaeota archaeon]
MLEFKCTDVSKIYLETSSGIKTLVLRGIDLDINSNSGETIILYGASGSGKTTLIDILTLQKEITTGSYKINQKEVTEFTVNEKVSLYKQIGIVFQYPADNIIFSRSISRNLLIPLKGLDLTQTQKRRKIHELLNSFNLTHRHNIPPLLLSGGELQRLGIAIAIAAQPSILFLDEPFADQDFTSTRRILEVLKKIQDATRMTIFISSHNPFIADFADRFYHLTKGLIFPINPNKKNSLGEKCTIINKKTHLTLPPNVFLKSVNLVQMDIKEDLIELNEYKTQEISHRKKYICYLNPDGKLLIPKRLRKLISYENYTAQKSPLKNTLILKGNKE